MYSQIVESATRRTGQDRLTREVILDRAIDIVDEEGLDAVAIRRLARDLGVTPMALYWHFEDKEHLLDGLADRLLSQIDLSVDDTAAWPQQLGAVLTSLCTAAREHPAAAVLVGTRGNASDAALTATEVVLDILRRAGFAPTEATHIMRQAVRTTTALVAAEPGLTPTLDVDPQVQAASQDFLSSLPTERFPRIIEAAGPLSVCDDPDAYYDLGLDVIIAGIETVAMRRAATGPAGVL